MIKKMRKTPAALLTAALFGALLSLPQISFAARASGATAQESPSAGDATAKLNKSQFKDVKVSVDNGVATLTGTVPLYLYKADAEKRVLKAKGVKAVRNQIEVAGPNVPDRVLENKLREQLAYDRVGYGNRFDAITVRVENGVVTVGGNAHTPWNQESAMGLIAITPGVKGIAGKIDVDPVSPMDDQTRIAVSRAIYGYPTLNKYAIDPEEPIRISVQNGNVELYGTVDSQADKEVAFMQANRVPGVFSVKNYLQVEGSSGEGKN